MVVNPYVPRGGLMKVKDLIPKPPKSMSLISWNIDGIKAHFDSLKILAQKYHPEVNGNPMAYVGT